ncbi:ABC transporter permease [Corynebacterium kutscheri]|uniref:ABC transporter permease n=1 Tax=Corynebacterium kutscheri TaxID=35755 RepID=A0A0F6TEV7_9CORY|nr:metal ABC transporter permease [Corynebacterium kutscheri]AKE42136.1 ABC-type Mn2+/Zn2+ transport system, permease component [Corynebacterium kutscheri]VEH05909.1 ABC transporter permease [Corynebacterium kutscheri]VEH10479.1 ABC transporter permease [Corynebacterium kutscheri]VEH81798.1 ABC transporter permease [Corynebacterium kutscheri]
MSWSELAQLVGVSPFIFRPLILLTVLAVVCGIVGVIVNLRGLEFNAEAIVHSIFPGIVAGAVFGGTDMIIPVASAFAIILAIVLSLVTRKRQTESSVAIVLTTCFSLGAVLSLKKGDQSGQLEALMFGRLLEVTDLRLNQALIVCAVSAILMLFTWKDQVFVAFDRVGAHTAGVKLLRNDIIINAAIAAVVVASSTAVGVLLVIGYIVIPGAAARLVAPRISRMVPIAIGTGLLGGYIGLTLVPLGPVSPQAVVAMSMVTVYLVLLAGRKALT